MLSKKELLKEKQRYHDIAYFSNYGAQVRNYALHREIEVQEKINELTKEEKNGKISYIKEN